MYPHGSEMIMWFAVSQTMMKLFNTFSTGYTQPAFTNPAIGFIPRVPHLVANFRSENNETIFCTKHILRPWGQAVSCYWQHFFLFEWLHFSMLNTSWKHGILYHWQWNPITVAIANALRPRQNGRQFADNIFNLILLWENCCILLQISLKLILKVLIINKPAMILTMAWRWRRQTIIQSKVAWFIDV